MTTHRITYEGPGPLAVSTATMLADATGISLTSSHPPERRGRDGADVHLRLVVEGSAEAVAVALARIRERLPDTATITSEESGA